MATAGVAPAPGLRDANASSGGVDKLPDELNGMKIRDDRVNKDNCILSYSVCITPFSDFLVNI